MNDRKLFLVAFLLMFIMWAATFLCTVSAYRLAVTLAENSRPIFYLGK